LALFDFGFEGEKMVKGAEGTLQVLSKTEEQSVKMRKEMVSYLFGWSSCECIEYQRSMFSSCYV
jgi:hypothetical protein